MAEIVNNCGYISEVGRTPQYNVVRVRFHPLTKTHYHNRAVETYKITGGTGFLRMRVLGKRGYSEKRLARGTEVVIQPRTLHQVKNFGNLTAEVKSEPAWQQEDEIEVEESLF